MFDTVLQTYIKGLLGILFEMACDGQTKPDGKNCTICGDNGHQAFECENNAFNKDFRGKS